MGAGRKSKYDINIKPNLAWISEQIKNGVIEAEIAKALKISVATLNNYKLKYPEFKEALTKDKAINIKQKLINAGVRAAIGYFEENETTTIVLDKNGLPKKTKVITKTWYPPNPALNKFYVMNYCKDEGFTNDPLEFELKKAKNELEQKLIEDENWDKKINF